MRRKWGREGGKRCVWEKGGKRWSEEGEDKGIKGGV